MESILCPVDFQNPALEGMEYAAHMAKQSGARLSLLHVLPSVWPEAVHMVRESAQAKEQLSEKLAFLQQRIVHEFGIACDWHLKHTTNTIEESIGEIAADYDLIVMGTNGEDDFYQYAFGSNTFQVMSETKCPLVVVPKGCRYSDLQKLTYLYDPEINPIYLLDRLTEVVPCFPSTTIILDVLHELADAATLRSLDILKGTLMARNSIYRQWGVHIMKVPNLRGALASIHDEAPIVVSYHQRTMLEDMIQTGVVRHLSRVAQQPIWVLHR